MGHMKNGRQTLTTSRLNLLCGYFFWWLSTKYVYSHISARNSDASLAVEAEPKHY